MIHIDVELILLVSPFGLIVVVVIHPFVNMLCPLGLIIMVVVYPLVNIVVVEL